MIFGACRTRCTGLFLLLFGLVLVLCTSPASAQTKELDTMFSSALSKLENSASKIESLQSELSASKNNVSNLETLSEGQKATLLQQATTLEEQSNSLSSINSTLTSTLTEVVTLKTKLSSATRWVVGLGVVLLIRVLTMIAGYIIYAKGIKLPRWLDILL